MTRRNWPASCANASILVRHFRQARIDQFLRITVGTDAQCEALISALKKIFFVVTRTGNFLKLWCHICVYRKWHRLENPVGVLISAYCAAT